MSKSNPAQKGASGRQVAVVFVVVVTILIGLTWIFT